MANIGEIYLIRNKETKKCYVGQALKTVGKVKQKWGTNGRWKCHIREANNTIEKGHKDHCVLLNSAIRKHGQDNFDVITLCECATTEEIDEKEAEYIKIYNSLVPNGYNLNYGGAKGKDSDETREKKRQMRLGQTHDEETKKNISKSQLGNRRDVKKRTYQEDVDLPKYIAAVRDKDKKINGYKIAGFPIGIEKKEYIYKTFSNIKEPQKALEQALEYLNELQEKYKNISEQILDNKKTEPTIKIEPKIEPTIKLKVKLKNKPEIQPEIQPEMEPKMEPKIEPKIEPAKKIETKTKSVERNSKLKAGNDKYDMPKYIYLKKQEDKEVGFVVDGLRIINDDGTVTKYYKSFISKKYTPEENLKRAIEHLEEVKKTHKCLIDEHIL